MPPTLVDSVNWWVQTFALLRPYLDARSAKHGIYWLVAHGTWHACPQLPAVLPDLFIGQTFRGLGVCSNWQKLPPTQCFLHRGCQCAFRACPPLPPPGRPKLPAGDFESREGVSRNVPPRGQGKALKWCPLWVTRGSPFLQPDDIRDNKRSPCRAWHLVEQNSMRQPPQAACRIHPKIAHAFQEAEKALIQSSQFWRSLVQELSEAEGEAGVSHHLASHWQCYEACFDFQKLVVESPCPPEDHHPRDRDHKSPDEADQVRTDAARAFEQLWGLAHPHLAHSIRPPADRGEWQDLMPARAPTAQYRDFMQRLQSKWHRAVEHWRTSGRNDQGWLQQRDVFVIPVLSGLPCVNKHWTRMGSSLPRPVEILLNLFGGKGWATSCDRLAALRSRWALRARCHYPCVRQAGSPVRVGHLAGIRLAGRVRVVIVADPLLRINCTQLGQDIEQDRFFSEGGMWSPARLWHRARRLGINESPAESWCGVLSRLWNPVQGPLTGPLVDRLRLCAGGVKGNTLDDTVVDKVAATIRAKLFPGRHPHKPELFKRRLQQVHLLHKPTLQCKPGGEL